MSEEITSRIRRDELLGLLHPPSDHERITARMPAITLEGLLVSEEVPPPPPFGIRFRTAAGTDAHAPVTAAPSDDAVVGDDIEPELSAAITRVTSNALDATLSAAIDAAVRETLEIPVAQAVAAVEAAHRSSVAITCVAHDRTRALPMLLGFTITFFAGVLLMMLLA
jgi:hypothetical protein